jgi:hypothetical protein
MKKATTLLLGLSLLVLSSPLYSQVVINEFSAANFNFVLDNYGEYEDWVELYNTSSSAIDLSGYYLSDRIGNPDKWEIPNGVTIGANDYLVIWLSDRDEFDGTNVHASFKLTQTRNNEDIVLSNPAEVIIDSHLIETPNQGNHSWGRVGDGATEWGVLTTPTPGSGNVNVKQSYASKPIIEPAAGFYDAPVEVSISSPDADVMIYYTLDGSTPSINSTLYGGPFEINTTTVVKTIAISPNEDIPPSFVDFHTFFINDNHTIPVISISGEDLPNLLDGNQFAEPLGYFELFENGERVSDATGEFNKHGNDSWAYPQRGIDYITRDQLGDDHSVKHQVFPEISERDQFQRLIIKAAANDNYPFETGGAHIRDAYVHTLSQLAGLDLDERTYKPCVMYLNGEYWGVYEIREKVDDNDYTDYYYDQGRKWIDFIKTWGITWEEYGSWDDWYDLRNYINTNDMTDPANYAYVTERLNVNSLIDYIILHSHNVSSDWLNWNTGWWRGRKEDGGAKKWRYILWDEDATFGHYINFTGIPDESPNADPCNPEEINPGTDFEGHIEIFSTLAENEEFFAQYINRYADLNSTYFRCDFMIPLLDSMIAKIEPEMPRQFDRWGGNMSGWQENVQNLRDFIETRCTIIEQGIVDCYEDEGITGPYELIINVEPQGTGKVKVNSIEGINYPWNATYYGGIDIELEAIPTQNNQFLYWTVANNVFGPDEFSDAITMSLITHDEITAYFSGAVPCVEPFNLVNDSTFTTMNLDWDGAENAISYVIRYRPWGSNDDWEVFSNLESDFAIMGLQACTQYEVQIRSVCPNSASEYITFITSTACLVDTEEAIEIAEVQAYPNPFREDFTVDMVLTKAGPLNIKLYNAVGQEVFQRRIDRATAGQHRLSIDASANWSPGVYWLQIEASESRVQKVLVRQ